MGNAVSWLNREQAQVAENLRDHLLLLAGAGTGKTNTLAYRVAGIIESGAAKPSEVLCLTFTNRACREMSERIEQIVGGAVSGVVTGTVHSFCARILRETPPSFTDVGRDFTVCDTSDALEVIREVVLEETGRAIGDHPLSVLQSFIALLKERMLRDGLSDCGGAMDAVFTLDRAALERICVDERRQPDEKFLRFLAKYGASLTRLYNLKLAGDNMLDFSDLLLRASEILSNPETAPLWNSRYRFIHVDEVQDMSLAEYELIERLCENMGPRTGLVERLCENENPRTVLLLCGDFNQTIYGWRGSQPKELTERFTERFSPLVVKFTKNYRSSPELLATAQKFLRGAFDIGDGSDIDLASPGASDISLREFETIADETSFIYSELAALPPEQYSRAAIITRTNRACEEICELLRTARAVSDTPVRFMLADELKLFSRVEIKDALAAAAIIGNPRDSQSLARVLSRLAKGVGRTTIDAVISRYREGLGVNLCDFTDPRTETGDYFAALLEARAHGSIVVFDVESTGTDVYRDDIIQLAAIRLSSDGAVASRFERFLRPEKSVGASERVHGFSDAFLAENGIESAAALAQFLDFVDGCVIVGHNVQFDMSITSANLTRCGIPRTFTPVWYDTLELSRRFLKTLPNHKLGTVASALHAEHAPSHDAMDDILATADVLNLMTDTYLIPLTEKRREFYEKYLPRFSAFSHMLTELRCEAETLSAPELLQLLLDRFGITEKYADEPARAANLLLLLELADETADKTRPPADQLAALLELSALSAGELRQLVGTSGKVAVITAHQAKGCEFDYVFLPMLTEGVFPTFQSVKSGDVNEEARVFYVSITRAKKKLFLSWAHYDGRNYRCRRSRFWGLLDGRK